MNDSSKIRVAIIGATAYTSREAIRWLLRHPRAQITALCSRREPQPRIEEIFPDLAGQISMRCEPIDPPAFKGRADVAFLCVPNGLAMSLAPQLLAAGLRVVDFSADYRLKEPADYEQWYDKKHTDLENLERAVYGIPEFYREKIRTAALVANPGCYPTSAALGIVPLVKAGLIDPQDVIVDSASGVSGAGREPKPEHHFPERNETFEAYKVGEHRHMVEIERTLDPYVRGRKSSVIFTPHLVPMERGILSTIYLKPVQPVSVQHVAEVFGKTYANEPFIRLRQTPPRTADVARTNFCDITARVVKGRIIVLSAIDNMVKGAAGQAIQNMNVMFGLDETTGLLG
ncbi:MAG TPA: N-acetyl-gamma-glutamyl-phosphate reductase [Phycisphaerae bacterium]|jgi:N-acetyl-gamma-glutamyl-phosphate reductase|nr:N-acetyl-gamma-glutamyl-phosphate reductase [Phycisphaerae bacterium]HOB73723.1 N-acetyl-gamma-glutamyl-phosphate reductase [Phycisphaerae bacterium]HOJ53403.1 N-acetyl-gamma-glutamyl-phosphate reductase [Phycisphaerae bacterium]HOL25473.1 N-acetyl-gamma-glutamyl-phosphate reductase [Phycisphaerae bacterium]HPP19850.1 N-acetyl-gamma-glutamyl-phosphate reductase [Phycisphaerae bacterium]